MKRILITGVTGFLGISLVKYFKGSDDLKLFGYSRGVKRSITDTKMINTLSSEVLNQLKIEVVIHLAGLAHDLNSQYHPEDYDRVNFEGTRSVYDEFLKSEASKFIFLSSVKAVAESSPVPLDESAEPDPLTDYGKSKLKAERYLIAHEPPTGKYVYILRPCMIHGPGNKGNLNLLYRFVKRGIPYPLGGFENKRSFLSIDNFTFVIQKIIETEVPSGIYHLADSDSVSTRELYKLIARILRKKPQVWNIPTKFIRFGVRLIGKNTMLDKLTEDFVVSNKKILSTIKVELPVGLRDGLTKTIKSFNE